MFRLIKPAIFLVLTITTMVSLLFVSIYGYSRLTDETLVAAITFDKQANNTYVANLMTVNHCQPVVYLPIYGDQWRIDARFLKWKSWATLLGMNSQYRLDRLEGRYSNIVMQNNGPHQAHDLAVENVLDIAKLEDYVDASAFLVDTEYGSSVYHTIKVEWRYEVYRSQSGLLVRAAPRLRNEMGIDEPMFGACEE
mgnify:CR=1 FL=1